MNNPLGTAPIGPLSRSAIWYDAMTRPCIDGSSVAAGVHATEGARVLIDQAFAELGASSSAST